ncbi:MAG TPA: DUF4197 domain-containing protein [Bacteroidales bacterium]|nr:DUF4197 domain-containing protein [Bacteroidales bacterium]
MKTTMKHREKQDKPEACSMQSADEQRLALVNKGKRLSPFYAIFIGILGYLSLGVSSCEQLVQVPMSETEVAMGLREALTVGITNAVLNTSKEDGFFGNSAIKIPFPPDAAGAMQFMENSALLRPLLHEFVKKLNRAAEGAAESARPIFADAIRNMSITDAWNILRGGNNAATNFLRSQTYDQLYAAFRPEILASLNEVGAQRVWSELTGRYNTIAAFTPNLTRVNTDLAHYATTKALDGLFTMVAQEEQKIRQDPVARVTELLRRVFARQ